MSKASRVSVKTVLKIGRIKAPIGLMKATGDLSKSHKWEVRQPPAPAAEEKAAALDQAQAQAPASGDPLGDDGKTAPPEDQQQTPEEARKEAEAVKVLEEALKPRKGVLKDDGSFIDLTDEIEAVAQRSKTEYMEVVAFIDRAHVPSARITASYYLAAGEMPADAEGLLAPLPLMQTLAAAMEQTGRYMVVRFSKKKGQTLGIVKPQRDGSLLLNELVFSEQWREPGPKALMHNQVEVSTERVEQASELIVAMAGRRDSIDSIGDLRAQMEDELIAKAQAGEMDAYELAPVDPDADPDAERLGELLQQAVAEAV